MLIGINGDGMATFLFDKIIFGPVNSRRLGLSLGINLLPNQCKLCNFNCIYCECGWTPGEHVLRKSYHPRDLVARKLESRLHEMKKKGDRLDVITFAGNGEPTLHPEFEGIVNDTVKIRNAYYPKAKIAVLSNASLIHKKSVFNALSKIELNILKLDSVYNDTINAINQPRIPVKSEKLIKNLKKFKSQLIIQTLFFRGIYKNKKIDNTTPKELEGWLKAIKKIKPEMVMIYTYARNTAAQGLEKIPLNELKEIAKKVNELGIQTQISE